MREADRQRLVDFVNTLEDLTCSVGCVELWRSSFDFWRWYVEQGLTRVPFYLNELSPEIGIELKQSNLDAVRGVLRPMVVGLYCGSLGVNDMREIIADAEGISELQRAALYQMVEVRQQEILGSGDPNSLSGICAPTTAPPEPPPPVAPTDPEPGVFTLKAVPQSPTEMVVLWSYGPERVTRLFLYRDGERLGEFPAAQTSYLDEGLNPNERHEYRVVFWLGDGSWRAAETTVATLAHAPRIYGPMGVTGEGFKLAIVSDLNPPETEYRIILSDQVGVVSTSDWGTSRCRTFDGLQVGVHYRIEAAAVNLDGTEAGPVSLVHLERGQVSSLTTQSRGAADDAWVAGRLNAASSVYGLTDRARTWMLSDLAVDVFRNEPTRGSYNRDHLEIGGIGNLRRIMREMMYGFWEHWDSFPKECGEMNSFTFKQDIARFMLEFKGADDQRRESVWEDWRPFYRFLRDIMTGGYSGDDDPWELLAREEFGELRSPLFSKLWADIPSTVAGKLSLIPSAVPTVF